MTQNGPGWPKYDPKWPKYDPKWSKVAQKWPKMAHNYPQMAQKWRPDLHTFFRKLFWLKKRFCKLFSLLECMNLCSHLAIKHLWSPQPKLISSIEQWALSSLLAFLWAWPGNSSFLSGHRSSHRGERHFADFNLAFSTLLTFGWTLNRVHNRWPG